MKTMKKTLLSLMVLLSAILILPGVVQARTKTELLNTSVKAFIKAAKKMDEKQLKKYVKNWEEEYSLAELKDLMPRTYKAIKKNASRVTYKVLSKKKKGNTATVALRVKYPKYTKAADRMLRAIEKYYEKKYGSADFNMEAPDGLSEEEIAKLTEELLAEIGKIDTICAKQIKNCPKSGTASKKITVTFVKSGSRWVMKEMPESLANAMYCDLIRSLNKVSPVPMV